MEQRGRRMDITAATRNAHIMKLSLIIILYISYITVQQQGEMCKKNHQKYNHAVANNSTTWLLNTLQCRLNMKCTNCCTEETIPGKVNSSVCEEVQNT